MLNNDQMLSFDIGDHIFRSLLEQLQRLKIFFSSFCTAPSLLGGSPLPLWEKLLYIKSSEHCHFTNLLGEKGEMT